MVGPPLSAAETLPYRACNDVSDCVFAQNGCCDCANNGEAIGVNKAKLDEFRALFKCEKANCTMRMSMPACNVGKMACTNGACEYKPDSIKR